MGYTATIVGLPDLRLIVSRADEFPSGLQAAWDRLESRLSSLKGRKFYGASRHQGSELACFAGVVPASDEEITALGLPTMMIRGGEYARAKLLDWRSHTDKMGRYSANSWWTCQWIQMDGRSNIIAVSPSYICSSLWQIPRLEDVRHQVLKSCPTKAQATLGLHRASK